MPNVNCNYESEKNSSELPLPSLALDWAQEEEDRDKKFWNCLGVSVAAASQHHVDVVLGGAFMKSHGIDLECELVIS